ncbi:U6 snRNA phosphodiesterase 1 isoform X1 [Athalia rosae]|uniref:U6 snRNA phosphodiesterase 1 isoform X1 n=1 Tax=Athalia rosae TaxID=37344 RepID=UPI0020339A4D|nr:U6 snRNA phosphodiesterase 1 isoform X1 [Athalia rosae]
MSGLNLIQSYSSESDDIENEEEPIAKNPSEKLPIPQSILSWKGTKHHETVLDDPSKHDGRSRSFKHERGNWATLVYVEHPGDEALCAWVQGIPHKLGAASVDLKVFQEFHLSLTKSLILKFHWIESFVESVKKICKSTEKMVVEFNQLKVYCNEERNRTFLAIQCKDRSKKLKAFVAELDNLLSEYQLPPFYQEASFHVSILWCLGDAEEKLNRELPLLNESVSNFLAEQLSHKYLEISNINCKIGNKLYIFPLG